MYYYISLAACFKELTSSLMSSVCVAPNGVYTVPTCHHVSGELLPRLFTLTEREVRCERWEVRISILSLISHFSYLTSLLAFIFCCTFLRISPTGRYPASLLYGARTFLTYFWYARLFGLLYLLF